MQKNVVEYLENIVKKYPNKIGFYDSNCKCTFWQFDVMAKHVAMEIYNSNTFNKPIVVLVDRDVSSLACMMGILYSGNFYVPVDRKMPKQRFEYIIKKVNPEFIICSKADEYFVNGVDKKIIYRENCVDNFIEEDILLKIRNKILDVDPAYVIFTSGSTGEPKGIVVSHRSVIDFVEWMASSCDISKNSILANQAPFYFDLSVKDIFMTLKFGATLHVLSKKELMFPVCLVDYLNLNRINTLIWATSAFNLVANSGVLDKKKPKYLKKVILGGETLLAKNLNIWKKALPKVEYINLYGPTEVTVDCTYYKIDREFGDNEEVPIGRACENKEVILLDENLKEVEVGEVGEICVRGSGLAHGYFNDFEKTSQSFIQNPNNSCYRDIIYRTGDLAVKDENGYIYFKARKDSQIKHMGYRIELGEIEVAINSCREIKNAICFYDENNKKIVCFYEGSISEEMLIKHIENIIPKYMYPNILRCVDKMPHNLNGKIDRVKIKEMYFDEKNKEL